MIRSQVRWLGVVLLPLVLLVAPTWSDERPTVLFFGDSLTNGLGVGRDNAFPALVQAHADSVGCAAHIINAGLDGETTAAGLRRVDWILQKPVDVFVLELGGNDGLRGVPLAESERNLQGIIERVRVKAPKARLVIAGVRLPPNLGPDYTNGFSAMFARLADSNDAVLIPRLLEGVAGDKQLMRGDGIHPNEAGHQRVAMTVWTALAPILCPAAGDSTGAAQHLEGGDAGDAAAAGQADNNRQ